MTDKVDPNDVEELIAQFQRLGLREMHMRCGDFELHLSNDPDSVNIFSSGARTADAPAASLRATSPPSGDGNAKRKAVAGDAAKVPVSTPAETPVQQWPPGATIVRAPYLGTFYRSPKPGSPAYVELGTVVTPESELCIVEVMKLFTGVRAGADGKVHAILAKDGQMVDVNQPLFVVVPGK